MANIFVSQIKDALKIYYNKQQKSNEQIEENNKRFSPEYAEKANAVVYANQEREYKHTVSVITDIYSRVRKHLAIASFPNVEQLTADRLIFESGIDLSVQAVQGYVDRYTQPYNPTMLQYIQGWIDRQHTAENSKIGKYSGVRIKTPKDQLLVYKKFAESGLRLAESIHNNTNIMREPIALDAYADENFGANLFAVIGDGMKLTDYKISKAPDSVSHVFDNVNLFDGTPQSIAE